MIYDIQKASVYKRISALLFDVILVAIIAVGAAFALSAVFRYDTHISERQQMLDAYELEHGIEFDITSAEYEKMSEDQRSAYDDAYNDFASSPEVLNKDALILNLTLIITVFGILIALVIWEFIIPLKLGNGQTLGKKIFGIAVMRVDGVRISTLQLLIRSILGKYTVETMIPVMLTLMFFFGVMPLMCLTGIALIALLQVVFVMTSHLRTPIHDMIAGTVTVDLASQLIFDSVEELTEYKKRIHEEKARNAEYK